MREQILRHAGPLPALAGEHEHQPVTFGAHTGGHVRPRLAGQERRQPVGELGMARADHRDAVIVMRATDRGRVTHIAQRRRVGPSQQLAIRTDELAQRLGAVRRDRQHERILARRCVLPGRGRRLFHDDVRDRSAQTKRADTGEPRPAIARPCHRGRRDHLGHRFLRDVRIELAQVEVRRDLAMPQREHHLDQPCDAGSGLEMSDVGLHRPEHERVLGSVAVTEDGAQRAHLDRIAERRAGAMRLDVVNVLGLDARVCERGTNHGLLRGPVRHCEAAAVAVLHHRRAPHHREDRIVIGDRVR